MPQPARAPIQPGSIQEKVIYARELATAANLPRTYQNSPGDLLLAMSYAEALGIPLINAITEVRPVEGKPSASATLIRALVLKAGHKLRSGWARKPDIDSDERIPLLNAPSRLDPDLTVAWCEIRRKDDPEFVFRQEWTLRRAEVAQLLKIDREGKINSKTGNGKSTPWEKSPIQMLPHRALTACAREACPEAILGIFTADELGAVVTDDGHVEAYADAVEPMQPEPSPLTPAPDVVEAAAEAEQPSEFELAVQAAEEALDMRTLSDLGKVATEEKNQAGIALAKAAWYRVRDELAKRAAEEQPQSDELAAQAEEEPSPGGEE